jgi:hypothetical protein
MTKLLEQAVDTVPTLAPKMQDDLARLLLQLAGHEQPSFSFRMLRPPLFEESLAQASRREFATDAEVRAVWAKYGL